MQVFVTRLAERHFEAIVGYIRSKWGERTVRTFIQKTDEIFTLLKNYPAIGQLKRVIRGFQLSPQTRILYRIRDSKIIILAFFDVRQNPKKEIQLASDGTRVSG